MKRKVLVGLISLALCGGAALALPQTASAQQHEAQQHEAQQHEAQQHEARQQETQQQSGPGTAAHGGDDLPSPLQEKSRALRQEALVDVINGDAQVQTKNGSQVVRTGDDYVELGRRTTDRIFVVLAEFGNQRHPSYPDQDTDPQTPGPATFEGPLHNKIPEPGQDDNSTIWQPDYDRKHYEDLYFGAGESLRTYYETQSSGRYSVQGMVTDWVKVPYNEARYGRSNGYPCPGTTCSNTWALLADGLSAWVQQQKAAGRTDAQIKTAVAEYDQWDRYDFDGDGNFNEADGYIDHFQIVHAGGDQANGDPQQGEDAIWSHRWYTGYDQIGKTGPANNRLGGTQIGTTGLWVGDYTIQPENGGLSVFAHEYGHDLGLPDDYDTAGGPGNAVEWWSLMAQSRLSGKGEALGTRPGDLGAWNKLKLGWLDYETVPVGRRNKLVELGPQEYNTDRAQAVVVPLPLKKVLRPLPKPGTGALQWYSGTGNRLNNTLARLMTLPKESPQLTFQANWNIEDCGADACDYAYVEVSDGSGWKAVPGSITKTGEGNGIDGFSNGWKPATFDLSAYAGKNIALRFRYSTDAAAAGQQPGQPAGIFLDDIAVRAGTSTIFTDGAETLDSGWVVSGFRRAGDSETSYHDNYYIAGYRSHVSYDKYLETGPYNFGWASSKPDKVEHFPYQEGLLVSYWDTSQVDNNVSEHPGEGLNLYVDAHPQPLYRSTGQPWRTRIQMYDAPFSAKRADNLRLHFDGVQTRLRGLDGNPVFDDTQDYFDPVLQEHGVKLRKAGVRIEVLKQKKTQMTIRITTP